MLLKASINVDGSNVGLEYWEVAVSLSYSRLPARPRWLHRMFSSSKLDKPGDAPCAAVCRDARWRVVAGLVVPGIVMLGIVGVINCLIANCYFPLSHRL